VEDPSNSCDPETPIVITFENADFSEVSIAIGTDMPTNNLQFDSEIVEVSVIGKFDSATLCFLTKSGDTKDKCLAYFESKEEKWICQDKCLKKNSNNQLCGKTDHFTSFAILLGAGIRECGDDYAYVTGSFGGDLILVGCIAAIVCLMGVLLVIMSYTPCGKKLLFGKEGLRVTNLRAVSHARVVSVAT
jgi:hypothetical protein